MRKLAIFVIAIAMIVGGGYLLFEQFTASTIVYFRFVFAGGALVAVGLMLLWEDFISPFMQGSQKDTLNSDEDRTTQ
jgi:hypothetical protein